MFEAYSQAPDPLVVDLAAGVITGLGGDTISGFENIAGSHYGTEILRGDDGPNRIDGRAGDDTLVGAGGDDVLNGDAGTDDADGGDGTDLCTAETVAHCEG